jgi:hypothetical protein
MHYTVACTRRARTRRARASAGGRTHSAKAALSGRRFLSFLKTGKKTRPQTLRLCFDPKPQGRKQPRLCATLQREPECW